IAVRPPARLDDGLVLLVLGIQLFDEPFIPAEGLRCGRGLVGCLLGHSGIALFQGCAYRLPLQAYVTWPRTRPGTPRFVSNQSLLSAAGARDFKMGQTTRQCRCFSSAPG